jgi:hypothetical protein
MWPVKMAFGEEVPARCVRRLSGYGVEARHQAGRFAMYPVVYWTGITLFVAWIVFSAYSAFNGL